MRLAGITPESFVDGPGLRFVLFAQGCPHQCPFCHNPESWPIHAGKEFSVRQIVRMMRRQSKQIRGITFSGGEPFLQADEFSQIAMAAHQMGWDVLTYTGFTYEQLVNDDKSETMALLASSDTLIDGVYDHALRDMDLAFRGSKNQRIIDMSATQKLGQVMLARS